MKIILLVFLLLSVPKESVSQVKASDWETELGGGTVADLFTRGPWINSGWKKSFVGRMVISNGMSAFYEYVIEPWNGHSNASKGADFQKRLVGILATELVWAIGKKIL